MILTELLVSARHGFRGWAGYSNSIKSVISPSCVVASQSLSQYCRQISPEILRSKPRRCFQTSGYFEKRSTTNFFLSCRLNGNWINFPQRNKCFFSTSTILSQSRVEESNASQASTSEEKKTESNSNKEKPKQKGFTFGQTIAIAVVSAIVTGVIAPIFRDILMGMLKPEEPVTTTNNISHDHDTDNFQPRQMLERQLSETIPFPRLHQNDKPVRVALTGYSGSGKSALAKHFALRRLKEVQESGKFPRNKIFVWNFDSLDEKSLRSSYLKFASEENLGLDLKEVLNNPDFHAHRSELKPEELQQIQEAVAKKLVEVGGYTCLIFDQAVRYDSIINFIPALPGLHVDVIVTTQNSDFFMEHEEEGRVIPMNNGVSIEEGIVIFKHYLKNKTILEDQDIKRIIKISNYPRMIREDATYVNLELKKSSDRERIIKELEHPSEQTEAVIANRLPENSFRSHRRLVESLKHLNDNDITLRILNICSLLSPERMPIDFLNAIIKHYFGERSADYYLSNLKDYSFIDVDDEKQTFNIHESVQKRHRIWLSTQTNYPLQELINDYCIILLNSFDFFNFNVDLDITRIFALYSEQAEFFVNSLSKFQSIDQEKLRLVLAQLMSSISAHHGWIKGNYHEGLSWAEKALMLYKSNDSLTKEENTLFGRILTNKAFYLNRLERNCEEYINIAKNGAKILKETNGLSHKNTIIAYTNLVWMLIEQRKNIDNALVEARKYADEIKKFAEDSNYVPYIEELLRLEYYEGAEFDLIYDKLINIISNHENKKDYCLISVNNDIVSLIIENKSTDGRWLQEARSRLDHNLEILDNVNKNYYPEFRMVIYLLYSEISLLKQNYYIANWFIKKCQKIQSLLLPPGHSSRVKAQEIENRIWLKMLRDVDVHTGLFA